MYPDSPPAVRVGRVSSFKTHMRHLIEKTGCENRTHLALTARLSGLVVGSSEIGG